MYIAICDDDGQVLKPLTGIIVKYAAAHELDVKLKTFQNPEEMILCAQEEQFTHYFLDIMMPGLSGIETAEKIRKVDAESKLIFLSASNEFATQSYRVRAYDYLLKPVQETEILELMDRLVEEEEIAQAYICLQTRRSLVRIPCGKIACMEVNRKHLYFYLTDGSEEQITGTMAEFEGILLAKRSFVKIHRSYIVNLNQIASLSQDGCVLFSGKNLPVSRLLYHQVRELYTAHLFKRVGS